MNQTSTWDETHGDVLGALKRQENLPSKPKSVKLIPWCDTKQLASLTHTVTFWMHDCSDLPLAFALQTAHTRCRSRTHALWVSSPVLRHRLIRGVWNAADENTGAWKNWKQSCFLWDLPLTYWKKRLEMSSWLQCDELWWENPAFSAREKEK